MKLLFKQRFFSWFDSYDIYDEQGEAIFTVKGELAWGHSLRIFDPNGNSVGLVKEEVLTFLPKFLLYAGDRLLGEIRKEFTFFKPRFVLDFNGWEVEGDWLEWEYSVTDQGRKVMNASKRIWNFTDTYELDVARQEEALCCLMIVIAIDAAKCSSGE